ncbi:hypothetical protein [Metallosphaera sedula]|uniref:hypothetical protein n=1 Tax=Metallosphaera sedula TaxID=43687 RepID=UPI0020BE7B77|nr:hypothetical protein [Metallosphaera sedula]BBL47505.1 hypothetical protein MJ1HA_1606 [Metallosphaera sedula]
MISESQFKDVCGKVKALLYFGSYTREDYVDGISDINVIAITNDKSVLMDLASMDLSPVVIDEETLNKLCQDGDPLCYYVLNDSKLICGSLPNFTFIFTDKTCSKLLRYSRTQAKMSLEGIARRDEISSVNNLYRGIRSFIRSKCCTKGKIPLSDEEVIACCKGIGNDEICELFSKVRELRRNREPVTYWTIRRFVKIMEVEDKDSSL